jgi:polar amino acid transport system substrate-binding protein
MRVIGIANTTTIRAVEKMLKNTKITSVPSVDEALGLLRTGNADAFALTRDTLAPMVASVPGSRILEGAFRKIDFAVVLPKNHPQGLAYATQWIDHAKASGVVRKAFDAHGFKSAEVAPANAR